MSGQALARSETLRPYGVGAGRPVPQERQDRLPRGHAWIYRPARRVTQSAPSTAPWVVEFDLREPEIPDFLMGWIGSGDTTKQVRLTFSSLEQAIRFVWRQGLPYTVRPPQPRRRPPGIRPTWMLNAGLRVSDRIEPAPGPETVQALPQAA